MTDTPDPRIEHGMIAGSHERRGGPECRCGAAWNYWRGRCTRQEKAA